MESLLIISALALLASPVLAIIAVVKASGAEGRARALRLEVDQLQAVVAALIAKGAAPTADASPLVQRRSSRAAAAKAAPEPAFTGTSAAPADEPKAEPQAEPLVDEAVEPQAPPKMPPSFAPPPPRNVEQALASRWFVWVGGVAIALGGLLLVKYASDAGLFPPFLRVLAGLALAAALVWLGERTRNNATAASATSYVPAALSAAGLVIGFGVTYAAYALYGILSPAACFPLLVAIGLLALWLSRRQGPLIAALGLLGSYVAPMLVPSDNPSAPGFFAYLLVILLASLYELRNRPWWWLGFAALGGSTLWTALWMNGGFFVPNQSISIGVFALVMGAASVFVPRGRQILQAEMGSLADPQAMQPPMWIAVAGCAASTLLLAALVVNSQHHVLALLLFAIGMACLAGFGWMRAGLVVAPLAAAVATLLVLMVWPDVGFHEWAMDERGMWTTVPGLIEPPRFRNAMLLALAGFTGLGMAGVLRKPDPRPWAALGAAAAPLFLTGAWGRADASLSNMAWAGLATLLAVLLAACVLALRRKLDDAHSARAAELLLGGTALLLLFTADRLWDGVWYTISIAALASAMAYAASLLRLPNAGGIASVLAAFASVRLFIGREFWQEPEGLPLGRHWLLYGYGIPALLFWQGARWLKGDAFTRWRVALEGASLGLAVSLVSLELRVLIGGGITADHMTLLELAAHAVAWLGAAYGLAYRQNLYTGHVSLWGARLLLAASTLLLLDGLTIRNPIITHDVVEGGTIFNSLWLAYLAPVPLLALILPKLPALGLGRLRTPLGALALVLLLAFITLWLKRLFQGPLLEAGFTTQGESYAVSLAWLVTGIGMFLSGLKWDRATLRHAGLAVLAITVLKVFGLDLFALGGLWRIASIIGLGACLVGMGWLYTRFTPKPATPRADNPTPKS